MQPAEDTQHFLIYATVQRTKGHLVPSVLLPLLNVFCAKLLNLIVTQKSHCSLGRGKIILPLKIKEMLCTCKGSWTDSYFVPCLYPYPYPYPSMFLLLSHCPSTALFSIQIGLSHFVFIALPLTWRTSTAKSMARKLYMGQPCTNRLIKHVNHLGGYMRKTRNQESKDYIN